MPQCNKPFRHSKNNPGYLITVVNYGRKIFIKVDKHFALSLASV